MRKPTAKGSFDKDSKDYTHQNICEEGLRPTDWWCLNKWAVHKDISRWWVSVRPWQVCAHERVWDPQ